jgi:hypothetical protein
VLREGKLDTLKLTVPVNPLIGEMVTVYEVELGRVTDCELGDAEIEKLGGFLGLTTSVTVVEWFRLPDTPDTVMVNVPVVALLLAVSVRVLVVAVGFVPNDAVTPDGMPEAESETLPLKPLMSFTVIVLPPAPPCVIVTLEGEADRLKSGDVPDGARALIRPLPFGLPQPVAKS